MKYKTNKLSYNPDEETELEIDDYIETVYCRDAEFLATGGTVI